MNDAIFRVDKLKSPKAIKAMADHTFREVEVKNIDESAPKPLVLYGAKTTEEVLRRLNGCINLALCMGGPQGFTNATVPVLDVLVTTSPDAQPRMGRAGLDEYFRQSIESVAGMFGGIDNILTAALHQDETTEHLQILLMPMDYKTFRFASSRFIDGPGGLSKLQDQFHEEVAKKHGLKRGRRRSRDKHVPMRGFYANSASAEAPELVPVPAPPTFLDHSKPDEYAKKKKAHDEAVQANRRAQKLLEEQALVGRSIHPEIRARMARHDEEFEQREAEVQAKSKRAAKQLQEAKDREKAAQERLNAAFNREAEARKLLQHIPKAWEKSDAQIFDKLTQLIPAAEVARFGIQMGIELVPGKPLLRQLLEKGVGMTLTESMSRLAKVIDGAHYSHAPSGQSYYEAAVDAQPVNRLKDF